MSLSENIKNKRLSLKLSQAYVADQLGVSRQAVSKWEKGQSEPSAANLVELAALFEISLTDLTVSDDELTEEQRRKIILRANLTNLAIGCQAGALHACTQIGYITVDGERVPDRGLMLFKLAVLLLASVWMARNLYYEKDFNQRRRNSLIELVYCCVQLIVALLTLRFGMGLVGLLLTVAVTLVYVLHINPKYMNRILTKKVLERR